MFSLKPKIAWPMVLAMLLFLLPMSSRAERIPNSATSDVFDALLQNVWYLQTRDKQAQIYVTSLGQGPMVVVLNGGPGNDFNYAVDAVRGLAGKYRFVFFDQRGSVLSPVPPNAAKNLSIATLVADLDTLRQALHQQKVVLFGHSFGTLCSRVCKSAPRSRSRPRSRRFVSAGDQRDRDLCIVFFAGPAPGACFGSTATGSRRNGSDCTHSRERIENQVGLHRLLPRRAMETVPGRGRVL